MRMGVKEEVAHWPAVTLKPGTWLVYEPYGGRRVVIVESGVAYVAAAVTRRARSLQGRLLGELSFTQAAVVPTQ